MGPYSRYRGTTAHEDENGNWYLGPRYRLFYRDLPDNRVHTVKGDYERLWHIAAKYFTPLPRPAGLFWVIADFQPTPINDPTLKLEEGPW